MAKELSTKWWCAYCGTGTVGAETPIPAPIYLSSWCSGCGCRRYVGDQDSVERFGARGSRCRHLGCRFERWRDSRRKWYGGGVFGSPNTPNTQLSKPD